MITAEEEADIRRYFQDTIDSLRKFRFDRVLDPLCERVLARLNRPVGETIHLTEQPADAHSHAD